MHREIARRVVVVGVAAALVTVLGISTGAQGVDVTGEWAFTVETGMGSGTPAISFKQSGEALTGTYTGQLGSAPFKGTVKGNAIQFAFELDAQGQTIDVSYTGTVDGATMKGAVSMAGGQLSGTFAAKRK
jgi:hypothetical protein